MSTTEDLSQIPVAYPSDGAQQRRAIPCWSASPVRCLSAPSQKGWFPRGSLVIFVSSSAQRLHTVMTANSVAQGRGPLTRLNPPKTTRIRSTMLPVETWLDICRARLMALGRATWHCLPYVYELLLSARRQEHRL